MKNYKKTLEYILIYFLTLLIFLVDYFTYAEVTISFFYIVPVLLASRLFNYKSLIILGVICTILSFLGVDSISKYSGYTIYLNRFFVLFSIMSLTLLLESRKETMLKLQEKEKNLEHLLDMETELNNLISNQKNRLDTILSRIPGIVWETESTDNNPFKRVMYLSQSFNSFAGKENSLFDKSPFWGDYIHPGDEKRVRDEFLAIIQNSRPGIVEFRLFMPTERVIWVESHAKIFCNENNVPIGLRGVIIDITEKKEYQNALAETEQRFRLLADTAPVFIWISDLVMNCTYVNKRWLEYTGNRLSKELNKGWLKNIHPADINNFVNSFSEGINTGQSFHQEFRLKRKDGEYKWMLNTGVPRFIAENKLIGYIGSCIDITDRKTSELLITNSLKEKEVLLKEIHHRVKNNLQIISSILNLQSDFIKDPTAIEIFVESKNRIRSMALIHEKLYHSKNLSYLNFEEYVRDLIHNLLASYKVSSGSVTPIIEFDDFMLDVDNSIIFGLILNELVSNSLKYAFVKRSSIGNEIHIIMKKMDSNSVILQIGDNGIGFPDNVDFRNTNSLGLQLVNSLVEQLNGKIELNNGEGTEFRMVFEGLLQKKASLNKTPAESSSF